MEATEIPNFSQGNTYYLVNFEDETFARPLIYTYEYIGKDLEPPPLGQDEHVYYFRIVDSGGDHVIFTESQIWQVLDISGLIEKLSRLSQWRHQVKLRPQKQMPNPSLKRTPRARGFAAEPGSRLAGIR